MLSDGSEQENSAKLFFEARDKVTLKMDIPHTEHAHIIGKGGKNVQRIMDVTGCQVHFPDVKHKHGTKSSKVSLFGEVAAVEKARMLIQENLQFKLTVSMLSNEKVLDFCHPQSSKCAFLEKKFGITINAQCDDHDGTISIRCSQGNFPAQMPGIIYLMEYLSHEVWSKLVVYTQMEFLLHFQQLRDLNMKIHRIMLAANVQIVTNVDTTEAHLYVFSVSGSLDNVYKAWMLMMKMLPVSSLRFEVDEHIDLSAVRSLLFRYGVRMTIKRNPRSHSQVVVLTADEEYTSILFQIRTFLFDYEKLRNVLLPSVSSVINDLQQIPCLDNSSQVPTYNEAENQSLESANEVASSPQKCSCCHSTACHDANLCKPVACSNATSKSEFTSTRYKESCPRCRWLRSRIDQSSESASEVASSPQKSSCCHSAACHDTNLCKPVACSNATSKSVHSGENEKKCRDLDYGKNKILATQAMHRKIESESDSVQVPSNWWAGCGFSQSMPSSTLKSEKSVGQGRESDQLESFVWKTSEITVDESKVLESLKNSNSGSNNFSSSNYFDDVLDKEPVIFDVENDHLPELLCNNGLSNYVDIFLQQEFDLPAFLMITEEDMYELNIPYATRKRLCWIISHVKNQIAEKIRRDGYVVSLSSEWHYLL